MSLKTKIKAKIKAWLDKIFGVSDAPKPPITIPQQPKPSDAPSTPVGVDALPWESINWCGTNHRDVGSRAIPDVVARSFRVDGNNVYLDIDSIEKWGYETIEEDGGTWRKACWFCVFTMIDGKLCGGVGDALQPTCRIRDLGNTYDGYLFGDRTPARGGQLYFALVSLDGKHRTNMVKGQYK